MVNNILLGRDDFYNYTHPLPEDEQIKKLDGQLDGSIEANWIHENVPQVRAMRGEIIDDGDRSMAAEKLADIMTEFVEEGSPFQPSNDEELKSWLINVLKREVPHASNEDIEELVASVHDFPPIKSMGEAATLATNDLRLAA